MLLTQTRKRAHDPVIAAGAASPCALGYLIDTGSLRVRLRTAPSQRSSPVLQEHRPDTPLITLLCLALGVSWRLTGVPAGSTVAVKVRHPGVGAAILRDFATMMAVAHVASMLPSLAHLRLEQTLSQFAAPLREQVGAGQGRQSGRGRGRGLDGEDTGRRSEWRVVQISP